MAKASQKASENKLSENIGSIILGFVVVLILGGFLLNVFRGDKKGEVGDAGDTSKEQEQLKAGDNIYTVQPGETLWMIAENETGSGYNWQTIAEANNLENADDIEEGMELVIPDVLPETGISEENEELVLEEPTATVAPTEAVMQKETTTPTLKPKSGTYTVQQGDSLWKIAMAQYNDGYQWVKIAQANNLSNPDIIHSGNVLVLP